MASSHSSNTHSETARMEQIITEFFSKSLHIILESRALYASSRNSSGYPTVTSPSSPSPTSSSSVRPRDKWFNLALRDCPAALEKVDLWCQSNLEPIIVDVILVQRPLDWDPVSLSPKRDFPRCSSLKERWNTDREEVGVEAKSEKIVERWVLQYESRKTRDSNSCSRRSSNSSLHSLYKKLTLLLRSLYSTVRLLPAFKIFRDLNSSAQVRAYTLAHRVASFVEPFTRKDELELHKFLFTPVDTSCGRVCLSVNYCPSVADVISESSTPISPRVITDYVGSPLADPLRRFPSLPVTGLPSHGHGSPSPLPFLRRHSWSFDHCRASPPSIISSPSPTHSEPHTLVSNVSIRRFPPTSLPPHPSEMILVQKNKAFDENFSSPNMSPSPSPSPPIYSHGSLPSKTLLRAGSAPVSIPTANVTRSTGNSNRLNLPPSPPLGGSRCTPKTDRGVNMMQTSSMAEKMFSPGRDESRKYSATRTSSNSSPRISFSRSSSRSYQDDFDDPDFTCPFDLDDDDMTDPGSRRESLDHGHTPEVLENGGSYPIRKSQDAAVGELVLMLKKAPPLRQDFCTSEQLSRGTMSETYSINPKEPHRKPEAPPMPASMISSGLSRRTTTDALEEFQGYREMKNLLLMRGSKPQV